MKKYKVIQPIYKISEDKYYNVGDTIELNIPEGEQLVRQGMLADIEKAPAKAKK